jgi:hypothetical protein
VCFLFVHIGCIYSLLRQKDFRYSKQYPSQNSITLKLHKKLTSTDPAVILCALGTVEHEEWKPSISSSSSVFQSTLSLPRPESSPCNSFYTIITEIYKTTMKSKRDKNIPFFISRSCKVQISELLKHISKKIRIRYS